MKQIYLLTRKASHSDYDGTHTGCEKTFVSIAGAFTSVQAVKDSAEKFKNAQWKERVSGIHETYLPYKVECLSWTEYEGHNIEVSWWIEKVPIFEGSR